MQRKVWRLDQRCWCFIVRWDSFSLSRSSLSSLAAQPNSVRVNGSGQAEAWLLTAECFSSFVLMDNFLSFSRLSSSFKARASSFHLFPSFSFLVVVVWTCRPTSRNKGLIAVLTIMDSDGWFKALKRLLANLCFHLGRREGPFVSDLIPTGRSVEKYGTMICFCLVFIDGRD